MAQELSLRGLRYILAAGGVRTLISIFVRFCRFQINSLYLHYFNSFIFKNGIISIAAKIRSVEFRVIQ
jgi:hypothetical protein